MADKKPTEMLPKELFTWLTTVATTEEIEDFVDAGLRHAKAGPIDYLRQWLKVGRPFAYATMDDSWGEFEKLFAIMVKRLLIAERAEGVYTDKAFEIGDPVTTQDGMTGRVVRADGVFVNSDDGQQWVWAARETLRRVEVDVEDDMEAAEQTGGGPFGELL